MAETPRRIGFIGTGIMGAPMTTHLLEAGLRLWVHNRTRAKADALVARGAVWCDAPADVASQAELLCLERHRYAGCRGGVVRGRRCGRGHWRRGRVSLISARSIRARRARWRSVWPNRGVSFLDAPVTGGDVGARNATLTIMVGGEPASYERVRPVLELLGKTIVHVGPSGSGQALKACNQILCAVNMIGVCEALLLAERSELDLPQAIETLSGGAGGSWAWKNLGAKDCGGRSRSRVHDQADSEGLAHRAASGRGGAGRLARRRVGPAALSRRGSAARGRGTRHPSHGARVTQTGGRAGVGRAVPADCAA